MTAVTTPSNGTAVIASGTTVTYTPDAGFTGTDSLDYTLSDGADTDTGIVTVTLEAAGNVGGQGGTLAPPSDLTATPGSAQLALDWTDPGNSNIIEYQHSADGGTTFTDIPGSSAATTTYTVYGLTNGSEYTIAVWAVGANGDGPAATMTARPLLPAPENLAAPDKGRVVLQWDTGSSWVTNSLVRSQAVGGSRDPAEKLVSPGSGTKTTTVVGSLTDGTEYTFSVMVAEVSGNDTVVTGMASSAIESPTVSVQAAPTGLTATSGDGQVAVTLDNPGNITITNYGYSTNGGTNFTDISGSNADTTSYTITGLTNGNQYTLGVRSVNDSRVSSPATETATETATAGWPTPTNLVATPGDRRVTLEWDRGDSAIANYVIRQGVTGSGSFSNTILSAGNGATRPFRVINLTNGTEYTFIVGAGELDSGNIAIFIGQTATVTATPSS